MKDKTREAKSADPAPVTTRRATKPETEPEAEEMPADRQLHECAERARKRAGAPEAVRPGFTRKLSSFLFGEQDPVESEGVVVEVNMDASEATAIREQEELEPEC